MKTTLIISFLLSFIGYNTYGQEQILIDSDKIETIRNKIPNKLKTKVINGVPYESVSLKSIKPYLNIKDFKADLSLDELTTYLDSEKEQNNSKLNIPSVFLENINYRKPGTDVFTDRSENIALKNRTNEHLFKFINQGDNYYSGFNSGGFSVCVVKENSNRELSTSSQPIGQRLDFIFLESKNSELLGIRKLESSVKRVKNKGVSNNINAYRKIHQKQVYKGISLTYQNLNGRLSKTYNISEDVSEEMIRIKIKGSTGLKINSKGSLVIHTATGRIVQTKPIFYEISDSGRKRIKGKYVLLDKDVVSFKATNRKPKTSLIIDPEIVFQTYFGGEGDEAILGADNASQNFYKRGQDIEIANDGSIYIAGKTTSPNFPVTDDGVISGRSDGYVIKIDKSLPINEQLVYVRIFGGTGDENCRAIAVDDDLNCYTSGYTTSTNFPTTSSALLPEARSTSFIAKFDASGEFVQGTYLVDSDNPSHPNSIVYDKEATLDQGFLYVGGNVRSEVNSANGFQTTFNGGQFDGFISKINLELTELEYMTLLGGSDDDRLLDIDVNNGFVFATGSTYSADFPTTNLAYQQNHSSPNCSNSNDRSCSDIFVTRVSKDGQDLIYSTFYGINNQEEYARGIAVSNGNNAFVTGAISNGINNTLLTFKLEGGGENILWENSINNNLRINDQGENIVVDSDGRAHIVGTISVDGFATGPNSETHFGGSDIFYARLNETGVYDYFSYVGGTGNDRGFAIATEGGSFTNACGAGELFCSSVVGATSSFDLNTVDPILGYDENQGSSDLIITSFCDGNFSPDLIRESFEINCPNNVVQGENFFYTLSVTNTSDESAEIIIESDAPIGTIIRGVVGTGCSYDNSGASCNTTLNGGQSISIRIEAEALTSSNCPSIQTINAKLEICGIIFEESCNTTILCPPPLCGNGTLDPGEECDGTPGCRNNCTRRRCGDGIVDNNEDCDGGNNCTSNCTWRELSSGDDCENTPRPCPDGYDCKTAIYPYEECSFFGLFCSTEFLFSTNKLCIREGRWNND